MAGPRIPDINTIISAGINPKTGLPIKMDCNALPEDIKKLLRIVDEQDAINRYTWFNLPDTLDGELLERILYYRGQGAFFYMETNNTFYFLPYALSDTIDCYGRYTGITPLPFNGSTNDSKSNKPFIQGLTRKPVYEVIYDDLKYEDLTNSCVLLHDYCKQISQTTLPRQLLNEPILSVMSDCIPYMKTSLMLGTGVKGVRVNDADEQDQINIAANSIDNCAKSSKPWVPIIGNLEFQELTDGANLKGADYMQAMESLDNFRLGLYGIENGGLFQKKAHMLETEQAKAGGATGLVYQDGLRIRQNFCNIVNSIWGLGIWCDVSESVIGGDINRDGFGYDIDESQGQSYNNNMEVSNQDDTTI